MAPLWFVWDDGSLWLSSVVRSQRWTDLMRDPRVAVVIDAGVAYTELRGVELSGEVVPVGDIPRTATPDQVLDQVEQLFADKYTGGVKVQADGRHAWLRLTPEKLVSWDFRKLATLSRCPAERPRSPVISYQLYIDGAWTGSDGDSVLTVLNPATEEAIGTVPEGTVADIDRAVAAARRAFDEGPWPWLSPRERAAVMLRFAAD